MSALHSLVLAVLQGVTEFLPVSSSGHLALAQHLFNLEEQPLVFDVYLHFATMMATIVYFFFDIVGLLKEWILGLFFRERRKSAGWTYGWAVILGSFLTAVVAFALEDVATKAFGLPLAVSCGLVVTASLLRWAGRIPAGNREVSLWTGLAAGLVQGLAVMPGISRSGSTIAASLMTGAKREEAFRFSFLLSLPAIMGATLLEGMKASKMGTSLPDGWLLACTVAFVCGLLSLHLMKRVVIFGKWKYFALYCLLVAALGFAIGII
jgi:undecaprenyl-diphosphatase